MIEQYVISHNDFVEEVCAMGTTLDQAESRCKELKRQYMRQHRCEPHVAYFYARKVRVWSP